MKTQELYLHTLCEQIRVTALHLRKGETTGDDLHQLLAAHESAGDNMMQVCSVFFGGGTPSIWPGAWIGQVLACLREHFRLEPDAEITVECNPGTLDEEKLAAYRAAGVNRLSIGLQSANNERLRELGRIHTWEDFLHSWELVRDAGFKNVNIDLMSALPNQTLEDYEDTLKKVLDLEPEHISAYSLIVEEGTPFYEQQLNLPDEDTEREMYYRTKSLLGEKGYERYEISNYAKPGFACRHNLLYWSGVDYLGFGIGAASLYEGKRYKNLTDLNAYLRLLGSNLHLPMNALIGSNVHLQMNSLKEADGVRDADEGMFNAGVSEAVLMKQLLAEEQTLSKQDQMEEFCFLGLRRMAGISMTEFEERFGVPFMEVYGTVVNKYSSMGLLHQTGEVLALTDAGIDVSNVILADFLL
jgi:oxygen-independent coproporphyrinogen-3 oxidase